MRKRERERGLSHYLRKQWSPNWSEVYEPGLGSGTGYPDVQVLCPRNLKLLPIELKKADLKAGRVMPHEFQPTQPIWHRALHMAGGRSIIVMGIPGERQGYDLYAVEGLAALRWREGFTIAECYHVSNPTRFQLEAMVYNFLS